MIAATHDGEFEGVLPMGRKREAEAAKMTAPMSPCPITADRLSNDVTSADAVVRPAELPSKEKSPERVVAMQGREAPRSAATHS